MSEIARNLNTTMLAIQTYNNLPNAETVYNGMELKIPYGPPPLNLALPPAPTSGTRFVVSLSRQQCWVYQGDRILHSWPCSTGAGERRTKPGNYAVQSKILNAKSNVWQARYALLAGHLRCRPLRERDSRPASGVEDG
jgi:hypothetical protein